jgi:hypothetical protein
MSDINTQCNQFTDLDLQWFQGGVPVTDVINLVTEEDIVSEVDKEVTLTPKAYLSALSHIGTNVWEMLTLGGTHTQPPMLCGDVYYCPTCENADYIVGECEECYLISQ